MRYLFAGMLLAACSVAWGAEIEVVIEGPREVDSGGFALVGTGPEDAVLRWRVDAPDGSQPPLRLRDTEGRPVLVFLNPSAGVYSVVLTGQVPADGLDPFGESVHETVVGDAPEPGPKPDPDDDTDDDTDPDPKPDDLTAKVRKIVQAVESPSRATEQSALAALYGRLAPQVAAGTLDFDALMVELREGHSDAVGPSLAAWSPLFTLLAQELAANHQDKTEIARVLNAVAKGVQSGQ